MLLEAIKKASSIAVGGHVRPDGDCVGSCMGVYQYVRDNFPDKEIQVYLENIPNIFQFMKGASHICHEIPGDKTYDLFIVLDCGDMQRLGFSAPLYESAKRTLCVDHHVSNQEFADENYIRPEASSTSELIYDLLDQEKISKETAECLYTGLVHDTGVFRYSCTASSTMRAAAALMDKGIDFTGIISRTFDEKTYAQNQVLGKALLESFLFMEGRCMVSSLTRKEMEFYQVEPKHLDGIVSQMKLTKGVDVAIFMYELETGLYKVSLRSSEGVDVSVVAQYFGGGGHKRAAGFSMNGTAHDVINNLSRRLAIQMKNRSDS
ncbi:bifunctional oligoribonuclease/PAP phosphatase NrnA [Bariatricus massiliensis]|uniref:Bifunctional oligoribonuclease/PAP phosphatase NrnA n=1 Tax=Bariatricus massiliensis TaxID=1745713 RepID=A0ABS8DD54_9FIRM|nr:bifunctional oligoribonuclease/PAP phosphatase NrnA [Bariatricus massiliensis]MCB7303549.1 bifunctional oligoribonuclease/PAP phosphatase NrnA [Bariatricus massiliensis]MCB7373681.1 bifunctional oligoribonuclease/PAP phosphatase NrnA [Bariatricus massiliensis]MCB7386351.1 bifunctional oligoribonuclease/PAP phosphatase NrnA [Bariatricus massiliensis]MCB7410513.1 bifunctional oligoribonuclease/PAP phosphatase NrnA [Bariatricus massiliensis]MCQ5252203.1 bifunctional oligoribonuclease/PAP phosp